MLGMFEIGAVRRLDFGSAWSVVVGEGGMRFVTLKDVYRAWIGLLYTVVEMENALHNDYGIRAEPVTYDEAAGAVTQSPYKVQLLLQTHQRFMRDYLAKIVGAPLERLWAVTSGLHAEHHDVRWMARTIGTIEQGAGARALARLEQQIPARLKADPDAPPDPQALAWCIAVCDLLEQEDTRFLREIKLALRGGVQVFEQLQTETIAKGGERLLAATMELPGVLEAYYARVMAGQH